MNENKLEIRFKLHPSPGINGLGEQTLAETVPARGQLPRATQVLALAIHFQDVLLRGEARDYADLARIGGVSRERISQIMKLLWLAPSIQQEVLYLPPTPGGRYPISELSVRRIAKLLPWDAQVAEWTHLKEQVSVA